MVISGGAMAALAIISAISSIGTTVGTMAYNSYEAQKNRDFQEHMRNTTVSSLMNQAEENGISPSLLLGGGSNSLGGSQASVNANSGAISNSVNSFLNYIQNEEKMKTLEEMQEDRLNHQMQMQENRNQTILEIARMRNTATNPYIGRKYTREELENMYDDLDKIQL